MLRFSYALVPEGKVPSAGMRLTGISSPRPASIRAVTRRTNSGASSGTIDGRSRSLVAVAGTATSKSRASVPSTAAKLLATHRLALPAIGLADRFLDVPDGVLARQHAGNGEEAGLQDGVGAPGEADVAGDLRCVDDEEAEALVDDLPQPPAAAAHRRPRLARRGVLRRKTPPGTASLRTSWRSRKFAWWQATNPGLGDQVGRLDRVRAEAEMRDGLGARLVRNRRRNSPAHSARRPRR